MWNKERKTRVQRIVTNLCGIISEFQVAHITIAIPLEKNPNKPGYGASDTENPIIVGNAQDIKSMKLLLKRALSFLETAGSTKTQIIIPPPNMN